ncbi:hypothetical protein SAMN06295879_2962 [Agreia bicolorata]|uniref:Uncharacterized protein n=1 Tax=Agreia bicolorata TaxID=110935 RepID=A0A1T4YEM1_9MICO|nr:hypothetical protein SAMN06295879_2962 [Agreia bicolorata]
MDRSALEDHTTVYLVRSDDRKPHRPSRQIPSRDRPNKRTIDRTPAKASIDLERAQ